MEGGSLLKWDLIHDQESVIFFYVTAYIVERFDFTQEIVIIHNKYKKIMKILLKTYIFVWERAILILCKHRSLWDFVSNNRK